MGIINKNGVGRKNNDVEYTIINYNNNTYVIASILYKFNLINFVIDYDDYDKVKQYSWHISSGKYPGTAYIDNGKRKELYLHNLIMNKLTFEGKGQIETVDHINRNPLDNRKKNLKIVSQSEQNLNQKAKSRKITFPENYPIKPEDIPKHIWYVKENGSHGERFAIEFKTEKIVWKGTASKKIKIEDKLKEAKDKLQELYLSFPYLDPNNQNIIKEKEELQKEYEEIINLVK